MGPTLYSGKCDITFFFILANGSLQSFITYYLEVTLFCICIWRGGWLCLMNECDYGSAESIAMKSEMGFL